MEQVALAMAWLKERRVKRAAPGAAPPRPQLPQATLAAQAAIEKVMRETLQGLREDFVKEVMAACRREADRTVELCARIRTLREDFAGKAWRDVPPTDRSAYERLVAQVREMRPMAECHVRYDHNTFATQELGQGDGAARRLAEHEAERVFALCISRNIDKVAPIAEAKGGVEVRVRHAAVSGAGVETDFHMAFPDGSRFGFTNGIKAVRNQFDKSFYQFPARFHDVRLPDGTPLKNPSEARVKAAFVPGADAAARP